MDGRRATCIERYAAPFHPSRKPKAPVLRKQNTGHGQALSAVLDCCACWALREHGNIGQAGGSLGRPRSRLHESTPAAGQGRTMTRPAQVRLARSRSHPSHIGGLVYIYLCWGIRSTGTSGEIIPRFSQVNMSFETPGQPACGSTCAHATRSCRCLHVIDAAPCAAHDRRCRAWTSYASRGMWGPMSGMSSDADMGGLAHWVSVDDDAGGCLVSACFK